MALAALNYFPLPNRAGTATNANNFIGSSANRSNRDIVVGRLDHQFRPTDLVTARYYINNSSTNNSGTYGIPAADPLADITDVRVQSILGAYTHIFRPDLSNDFRYTYLRRKFLDSRPGYRRQSGRRRSGLKGVSDAAFPAFTIPGYGSRSGNVLHRRVYRFQTPIIDQQILDRSPGTTAGTPSSSARVPRRRQRRDPRPRLGRQLHHQPADHGPARRLRHRQLAGELPARRGERGQHPGFRQDSVARPTWRCTRRTIGASPIA